LIISNFFAAGKSVVTTASFVGAAFIKWMNLRLGYCGIPPQGYHGTVEDNKEAA